MRNLAWGDENGGEWRKPSADGFLVAIGYAIRMHAFRRHVPHSRVGGGRLGLDARLPSRYCNAEVVSCERSLFVLECPVKRREVDRRPIPRLTHEEAVGHLLEYTFGRLSPRMNAAVEAAHQAFKDTFGSELEKQAEYSPKKDELKKEQ